MTNAPPRSWVWQDGADEVRIDYADAELSWQVTGYDERLGDMRQDGDAQTVEDFVAYGPLRRGPESVIREVAAHLGQVNPVWLRPLPPSHQQAMESARQGDTVGLLDLVRSGVEVDALDHQGYTLLWWATVKGRVDTALELISAGADVNRRFRYGTDVLHAAVTGGHDRLVAAICAAGAAVDAVEDLQGDTALTAAVRRPKALPLVTLLVAAGAALDHRRRDGRTALMLAVRSGQMEVTGLLLNSGGDPNLVDADGSSALHMAAESAVTSAYQLLLGAGANPAQRNRWESTPLMEAALHGHLGGVRALLVARADVNAAAEDGSTALMHACYRRPDFEIITLLIDHGARLNAARKDGYTALMSAARNGTAATVELFLRCGADVAAIDGTGRDALAHASDAGNADTANILRTVGPANTR